MSARTTRHEARARILATFQAELDRLIPADESTPLKGTRFTDFQDRVEALARSTLPAVLEERAALELNARADDGGRCPRCGSLRVYLEKRVKGTEQFWSLPEVESILSLRATWLSQDDRWQRYWDASPADPKAA